MPDLTIAKSHSGNFTQGQTGATYSITATNSGSAPTSAAVSVTDTLPAGLTATAISGTGWTCVLGTLTCTRSDALAAGALKSLLARMTERGVTIFLTTHRLEEAERLCDRVAIIDHGKIIASGTKEELVRATVGEKREVVMIEKVPTLESVFLHLTGRELRE